MLGTLKRRGAVAASIFFVVLIVSTRMTAMPDSVSAFDKILPETIDGWKKAGPADLYTAATLSTYIDGGRRALHLLRVPGRPGGEVRRGGAKTRSPSTSSTWARPTTPSASSPIRARRSTPPSARAASTPPAADLLEGPLLRLDPGLPGNGGQERRRLPARPDDRRRDPREGRPAAHPGPSAGRRPRPRIRPLFPPLHLAEQLPFRLRRERPRHRLRHPRRPGQVPAGGAALFLLVVRLPE